MLITGGSRGIGLGCYMHFKNSYHVLTVSRTEGDFIGDLADRDFRKKIVSSVCPDVFINNAGLSGSNFRDQIFQVNFVAAAELALDFSLKMQSGHIINLLSAGSRYSNPNISDIELLYYTSKGALEFFSNSLQGRNCGDLKVTNLELGFVMTELANIEKRYKAGVDIFEKTTIVPMQTEYVAKTIDWVLAQPPEVSIAHLKIKNVYGLKPSKF